MSTFIEHEFMAKVCLISVKFPVAKSTGQLLVLLATGRNGGLFFRHRYSSDDQRQKHQCPIQTFMNYKVSISCRKGMSWDGCNLAVYEEGLLLKTATHNPEV